MARIPYRPVGNVQAQGTAAPARSPFNPSVGAPTRLRAQGAAQVPRPPARQAPSVGGWNALPGAFANLANIYRSTIVDRRQEHYLKFQTAWTDIEANMNAEALRLRGQGGIDDITGEFSGFAENLVNDFRATPAYKNAEGDPRVDLLMAKTQERMVMDIAKYQFIQDTETSKTFVDSYVSEKLLPQIRLDPTLLTQAEDALREQVDSLPMIPSVRQQVLLSGRRVMQEEAAKYAFVHRFNGGEQMYNEELIRDASGRFVAPRVLFGDGVPGTSAEMTTELSRAVGRIDKNLSIGMTDDDTFVVFGGDSEIITDPSVYRYIEERLRSKGYNVTADASINLDENVRVIARVEGGMIAEGNIATAPQFSLVSPDRMLELRDEGYRIHLGVTESAKQQAAEQIVLELMERHGTNFQAMQDALALASDTDIGLFAGNAVRRQQRLHDEAIAQGDAEAAQELEAIRVRDQVRFWYQTLDPSLIPDLLLRFEGDGMLEVARKEYDRILKDAKRVETAEVRRELELAGITDLTDPGVADVIGRFQEPLRSRAETMVQTAWERHEVAQARRLDSDEQTLFGAIAGGTTTQDGLAQEHKTAYDNVMENPTRRARLLDALRTIQRGQVAAPISDGVTWRALQTRSDGAWLRSPPGNFAEWYNLTEEEQRLYVTRYNEARKEYDGDMNPQWGTVKNLYRPLVGSMIKDKDMTQAEAFRIEGELRHWFEGRVLETGNPPTQAESRAEILRLLSPVTTGAGIFGEDTFFGMTQRGGQPSGDFTRYDHRTFRTETVDPDELGYTALDLDITRQWLIDSGLAPAFVDEINQRTLERILYLRKQGRDQHAMEVAVANRFRPGEEDANVPAL